MCLLTLVLLCTSLFGWEHSNWLKQVENRTDEEAIAWLQEKLQKKKEGISQENLPLLVGDQCKNCFKGDLLEVENPVLYIFMSFSVPEGIWLSLSEEMADYPSVFVLRGLPNNSFKALAKKVADLKEKGMDAPIQIHPQLFKQHAVDKVPTFVFCEKGEVDKFTGAISLGFALEVIRDKGKDLSEYFNAKHEQGK